MDSHLNGLRGRGSYKIDSITEAVNGTKRIDKDRYSLILFDTNVIQSGKYPTLAKIFNEFIISRFGEFQQEFIMNEYKPPELSEQIVQSPFNIT